MPIYVFMKRRTFLTLTGAALGAPALPTASIAATAPSTGQMALASHLARYNPQISAAGVARVLKVPAVTAQQIMGDMARQGVIRQAGVNSLQEVLRSVADRLVQVEEEEVDEAAQRACEDGEAEA